MVIHAITTIHFLISVFYLIKRYAITSRALMQCCKINHNFRIGKRKVHFFCKIILLWEILSDWQRYSPFCLIIQKETTFFSWGHFYAVIPLIFYKKYHIIPLTFYIFIVKSCGNDWKSVTQGGLFWATCHSRRLIAWVCTEEHQVFRCGKNPLDVYVSVVIRRVPLGRG